jgi:hypothetical protein
MLVSFVNEADGWVVDSLLAFVIVVLDGALLGFGFELSFGSLPFRHKSLPHEKPRFAFGEILLDRYTSCHCNTWNKDGDAAACGNGRKIPGFPTKGVRQ